MRTFGPKFLITRMRARRKTDERPAEPSPPAATEHQHVHVTPREPDSESQPVLERRLEPVPEPEPEPPPAPEPLPPAAEAELLPEAEPPKLEPVPDPEPEPEPEPERVVALPFAASPREWNVWELERLARAHSGGDAVQDEERAYLLVYLREFATPEGTLPVDFDTLVRESFGELLVPGR